MFWQSPRTRKQAPPQVTTPAARAAGIAPLEIIVDSHEQYAYRFKAKAVQTPAPGAALRRLRHNRRRPPRCRRRAQIAGRSDLQPGQRETPLRLAPAPALPRAAVVVEERYSQVFKFERVRPALIADRTESAERSRSCRR